MKIKETELRNIIKECIYQQLQESEDGKLGYISGVLSRYGARFDVVDTGSGEEMLKLIFDNDTMSVQDEVISFLDKMGYQEVNNQEDVHFFRKKETLPINEGKIVSLVCEELQKKDVLDIIKKDKGFEKRVKEIATHIVTELFRVLWQHNGIFKNLAN